MNSTTKRNKKSGGAIASLTEVQSKSLLPGIAGKDILAKSNTGSGKTLAFLMVAIERILKHGGPNPKTSFPVVVLTPVTDLASQIMNVAKTLLSYHNMHADFVIGGTDEKKDIKRLTKDKIDVLVATPGRFKSILNQSPEVKARLQGCQTFVIDEADKMTDPGFLRDTKFIHTIAKNPKMQTLMFSATMSKDALMTTGLLKSDAEFIDVAAGTKPQVNTKVRQVSVIAQVGNHLDALVQIVKEHMLSMQKVGGSIKAGIKVHGVQLSAPTLKALSEWKMTTVSGYRVMIFLPSNAFIDYFAKVFAKHMSGVNIMTLHGGLSQSKRTQTSEAFRTTSNCILFTSDASARGVDYPDVSCVIQMGFDSRAEYLQRVGRTGRAGKDGVTYIITAPEENAGIELICDVLSEMYVEQKVAYPKAFAKEVKKHVPSGITYPQDNKDAKGAFRGWLGSLASKWKRLKMQPSATIELAGNLAKAMGLNDIPVEKLKEKLAIKKL
jgi:ATP-dependent RNA helicase MSS116, mitochondrial